MSTNSNTNCNKTCANCQHFDWDIFEDSFGPYAEEYCSEGEHKYVSRYAEPCNKFKDIMEE